jgi:hypothetical protein
MSLRDEQADFGKEFGLNPDVMIFTLNESELEFLRRQDPATEGDGGFQQLLVTLQGNLEENTNRIYLTRPVRARIRRYAFDYRQGGWQERLLRIFSRHLGPLLDGHIAPNSR